MKGLANVIEMVSMTTLSPEALSTEEGGSGDCTAACVTVYTSGCCTCSRTEVKRKAEMIVKCDWSETSMLRLQPQDAKAVKGHHALVLLVAKGCSGD